jgi:hypothetical protein
MDRREFLAASAAVAAFGLGAAPKSADAEDARPGRAPAGEKQLIELRTYHFASAAKREAFERFLAKAAIPALNRAGVRPVGAFKLLAKDNADAKPPVTADGTDLYVLLPHESAASVLALDAKLAGDGEFQEAGRDVLMAPKSDPAYTRYETSLLLGFDQCPRVEVPTTADTRVLQLRVYESHSRERNRKKVEMFDAGGEIAIFRRVGMPPVFFGEAVAGPRMPNLTYMLGFADEAAMKKGWDAFRADPEWKKLSKDPQYKDTVSQITNLVLRPVAGSQV